MFGFNQKPEQQPAYEKNEEWNNWFLDINA